MAETEGTYNYDKSPSANSTQTTIQERLRESVRQFHEGTVYDGRPEPTPEQIAEYEKEPAWIAATHIDALEKRVKELEEELTHAWRKAIGIAANEATDYGRRVPMARMYADRIAQSIRALNGGAKP